VTPAEAPGRGSTADPACLGIGRAAWLRLDLGAGPARARLVRLGSRPGAAWIAPICGMAPESAVLKPVSAPDHDVFRS
jgi:hypothetical protein